MSSTYHRPQRLSPRAIGLALTVVMEGILFGPRAATLNVTQPAMLQRAGS